MAKKEEDYFASISEKIDKLEHPELFNEPRQIENDGAITIISKRNSDDDFDDEVINTISENLPTIRGEQIDGVLDLYKELNKKYGLNIDTNKLADISSTFREIADPTKKEIFEVYLREYMDRLRLVCINQLGNTVYSLIAKLTNEETIRTLTIAERVELLDRLFEYMDKVNNMVSLIPKGDTKTELREIANRTPDGGARTQERNREVEEFVLGLINGTSKN